MLTGDTDPAFFAGLLDELARLWESLGPIGQLLVTALGVMLLMTAGASFALAMGTVGVMTMGHGPRTRPGSLHPQPSCTDREGWLRGCDLSL